MTVADTLTVLEEAATPEPLLVVVGESSFDGREQLLALDPRTGEAVEPPIEPESMIWTPRRRGTLLLSPSGLGLLVRNPAGESDQATFVDAEGLHEVTVPVAAVLSPDGADFIAADANGSYPPLAKNVETGKTAWTELGTASGFRWPHFLAHGRGIVEQLPSEGALQIFHTDGRIETLHETSDVEHAAYGGWILTETCTGDCVLTVGVGPGDVEWSMPAPEWWLPESHSSAVRRKVLWISSDAVLVALVGDDAAGWDVHVVAPGSTSQRLGSAPGGFVLAFDDHPCTGEIAVVLADGVPGREGQQRSLVIVDPAQDMARVADIGPTLSPDTGLAWWPGTPCEDGSR